MILLLDNYDSFTYNLVHYLQECGAEVRVDRNDALTIPEIMALKPEGIVISPGPGTPDDSGVCLKLLEYYRDSARSGDRASHEPSPSAKSGDFAGGNKNYPPIFGVCLGHQALAQAFGGKVVRAAEPMHGKISPVKHSGKSVFRNLPSPFNATRYHSLVAEKATLPECLEITAETEDGTIMGLMHKTLPLHGVQFHPESIASEHGHDMIRNFLAICR